MGVTELDEIKFLFTRHTEYVEQSHSSPIVTGYKYHRNYNASLVFDLDHTLQKIENRLPDIFPKKPPLGNRAANLLAAHIS